MLDFEVIPVWLPILLTLALLGLFTYLIRVWRLRRAMERKNASILKTRRRDAAKWAELQEDLRKQQQNDPPA